MANRELIYKICAASEWREAEQQGVYRGSAHDLRDGFIHFSRAHQLDATARKYFAGCTDLVLVVVDAARLGPALRYEPARDGDVFPHLYAQLALDVIERVEPLRLDSDGATREPPQPDPE